MFGGRAPPGPAVGAYNAPWTRNRAELALLYYGPYGEMRGKEEGGKREEKGDGESHFNQCTKHYVATVKQETGPFYVNIVLANTVRFSQVRHQHQLSDWLRRYNKSTTNRIQTPLLRFVVDLLWTRNCCTTNPQQIE